MRARGSRSRSISPIRSSAASPSPSTSTADSFRKEIARARTFGFLADVEQLWARGFALGASLDNAVVIGDDRVINPEGLRFQNEFVRHKALDAVGDIALAERADPRLLPLLSRRPQAERARGRCAARRRDAWAYVEAPARRPTGHAEIQASMGIAVYGPDVS